MSNLLSRLWAGLKALPIQMFGLQAVFGPGTGPTKKEAIMNLLKKSIGLTEGYLARTSSTKPNSWPASARPRKESSAL